MDAEGEKRPASREASLGGGPPLNARGRQDGKQIAFISADY